MGKLNNNIIVFYISLIFICSACQKVANKSSSENNDLQNESTEISLNPSHYKEVPLPEPYGDFSEPVVPTGFTFDTSLVPKIVVNEGEEIIDRRDSNASYYQNTSPVNQYAPLSVFFKGYESTPKARIIDYIWDFGDGSIKKRGFNSSHIYEKPGTYEARLYVFDKEGNANVTSIQITVQPRDGKTYYVDSTIGNDSCDGLSQTVISKTHCPWKTAYHAFLGIKETRYQNGDQILFRRNRVFTIDREIIIDHWGAGYGYLFSAYGEGRRPIIRYAGSDRAILIHNRGCGAAYITFQDLDFRLKGKNEARAILYRTVAWAEHITFNRITTSHSGDGVILFQGKTTNGFIHNSKFYDGESGFLFTDSAMENLSLYSNHFDLNGNHLNYIETAYRAVITENQYTRGPFGRLLLRMCGKIDYAYIARNLFQGWIDPVQCSNGVCTCPKEYKEEGLYCSTNGRAGGSRASSARYTWLLLHFAPNSLGVKSINNITLESNVFTNAEQILNIGSAENFMVRNNIFISHDTYNASKILIGSVHGYDQKPSKNIKFIGNTIWAKGSMVGEIFRIINYSGPEFEGRTYHEDIEFSGNIVTTDNKMKFFNISTSDLIEFNSNNNLFYTFSIGEDPLFRIDDTDLTLANWQLNSQKDGNSIIGDPYFVNFSQANNTRSLDQYNSNVNINETNSSATNITIPYRNDLYFDFNFTPRYGKTTIPGAYN